MANISYDLLSNSQLEGNVQKSDIFEKIKGGSCLDLIWLLLRKFAPLRFAQEYVNVHLSIGHFIIGLDKGF